MTYFAERRKYQRCENPTCKTLISIDRACWKEVEVCDISAGGLKFTSSSNFELNKPICFNVTMYNMLSEFNMSLEGHIVRAEAGKNTQMYSIKLENLNKYVQVQLDEIIKSKVTVKNAVHPVSEDGTYTFLFIPRIRTRSMTISRYKRLL